MNDVLGTEGNVRILRAILLSNVPIGVSELARQTGLQRSGVAKIGARLEDLGVIEAVGRGARNRQYQRASRSRLADAIEQLFQAERERASGVFDRLKELMRASGVRSAWIQGPVARGTDRPEDPILVGVLLHPAEVATVRQHLSEEMIDVQGTFGVTVDLRVMTAADLASLDQTTLLELEDARPLAGPLPLDMLEAEAGGGRTRSGKSPRTHAELDARGQTLGQAIAERIRHDPSLVEEARHYVERRMPAASPGERIELLEWKQVLETMSLPTLRRFLAADDERAVRLRQSLPFLHVLSPADRAALFAKFGAR